MLEQRLKALGFNPTSLLKHLSADLTLSYQDGVLCLYHLDNPNQPLMLDFNNAQFQYRLIRAEHEQVVKACRIKKQKHIQLLDATCGLGRDALLLQKSGFSVTAHERHPVLAALLADALSRLHPDQPAFKLQTSDARIAFDSIVYDVIYLDPMFPGTSKSARVKKDMFVLQQLHQHDPDDSESLFDAAWQAKCQRLVVKRPQKAPTITKHKPTFQINGKTCRFDVYQRR